MLMFIQQTIRIRYILHSEHIHTREFNFKRILLINTNSSAVSGLCLTVAVKPPVRKYCPEMDSYSP